MDQHHKDCRRAAGLIQEHLAKSRQRAVRVDLPEHLWRDVQRLARQVRLAHSRGWHAAAARRSEQLRTQVNALQWRLTEIHTTLRRDAAPPRPPTEAEIFYEILALEREFDEVELDLDKHLLCVTVGPIVLDRVDLGRFAIRLDWHKLGSFPPYAVVALEPRPAASNEGVTHPHVQDQVLCEGEGRTAIRTALSEGRLCDFFLIVSKILATYARGSAYVELDCWNGKRCYDCGTLVGEENLHSCAECDEPLCDDCGSTCTGCEQSFCSRCTSKCPACGRDFCTSCLTMCSACRASTCPDCLSDALCEKCHEKREPQSDTGQSVDEDVDHALEGTDREAWPKPRTEAGASSPARPAVAVHLEV